MTGEILESDVYKELDTIQNPSIVYPHCNSLFLLLPLAVSNFSLSRGKGRNIFNKFNSQPHLEILRFRSRKNDTFIIYLFAYVIFCKFFYAKIGVRYINSWLCEGAFTC